MGNTPSRQQGEKRQLPGTTDGSQLPGNVSSLRQKCLSGRFTPLRTAAVTRKRLPILLFIRRLWCVLLGPWASAFLSKRRACLLCFDRRVLAEAASLMRQSVRSPGLWVHRPFTLSGIPLGIAVFSTVHFRVLCYLVRAGQHCRRCQTRADSRSGVQTPSS